MRYEDASQMGSGQVDARNDADHLAAQDYGPATGNVISGTGTITGSAGLDIVGAGQGRITAIDGAGGSDTSFSAGKLSVQGQYGTLNIDARGNYSYERDPGTPAGVSDVFHYTLTTKAGATDNARLVINIGDLPKLATDATRVVPGSDGVVTLPAGVELSDIRVVGRDLVVTLPDGSTMIIVDGAIFVPQLVLGGVEVPATNLAALLIGSEPRPAAGDLTSTQQSSGGNFEVPVGPLDPGVPLGDLLPPTELFYTPPDFEEIGQFEEEDDPPVGGDTLTLEVDDDALSDGNNAASTDETNSGTLTFTAGSDDLVDFAFGLDLSGLGGGLTWTRVSDTLIEGRDGGTLIVSLTLNAPGSILGDASGDVTVTLTLSNNYDSHPTINLDDLQALGSVIVVATEDDGTFVSGSVSLSVSDDVPIATDDGNLATVDDNVVGVVIGTSAGLLTNDNFGADGQGSPAIVIGAGSLGGTVTINGLGQLVYTAGVGGNVTPGSGNKVETFTYTIKDGDGDTDPATFTVTLTDTGPTIAQVAASIAVDEEGLSGGIAGTVYGDGSDLAGTSTTQSGTLAGLSFGGDGPGNIVLTAVADTGLRTLSDQVVKSVWDNATHTLTGFVDTNGNNVVDGGETQVFTLQITNVATGAYTYTQLQPVKHVTANTEDNATFNVGVTVTDSEGDPANGSIAILIDDDSPDAVNDGNKATLDDGSSSVVIGTAASLLTNDLFGADGQGTPAITSISVGSLGGTVTIVAGNLVYTSSHNTAPGGSDVETFTYTIQDGDGDTDTATFTVTLTDEGPSINELAASIAVDEEGLSGGIAGTVYGDGSDLAGTSTTQSGTLAGLSFGGDGPGNIVLTAVADTGLRTLSDQVVKSVWDNATHTLTGFVDTNGNNVVDGGETQVFTLQITNVATGAYTYTQLQPVKHVTANTEDNATFNVGVTVTDAEGDPANGSIAILIDDDSPKADDDGSKGSYDDNVSNQNIGTVASLLANDGFGADGAALTFTIAVGTLGGTVTIDGVGNLIYTPDENVAPGGSAVETFTYTITDRDGDTDTATFTVTLTDEGPSISPAAASISVDEEGLTGGIAGTVYVDGSDLAGTSTTQSGTLAGLSFGVDGPGEIVLAGVADTGLRTLSNQVVKSVWNGTTDTLTGFVDTNGNNIVDVGETQVFTLQITNVALGVYTYTQLQPVKHLTANTEDNATFNVAVTVTDAEGDPANGTISVLIDDDSPDAVNDGSKGSYDDNVSNQNIGTVASLLANDGYGADGAAVSNSITIAVGSLGGTVSIVGGNLIYTPDENVAPGGSAVETFTYTITDGDGDTDTATFTVTLTDEGPSINAAAASIAVDEEGLAGGIAGTAYGDGSDLAGQSATQSGTLAGLSFGVDGPGEIVLAGVADTGLRTLSNQVVKSVWNGTTDTLTGFVDTNGNNIVDVGETQVFTLQITNVNTGAYTFTLLQPVKHATANTEDNATFNVGVTVTDAEGDPANGTISVLIDDDSPITYEPADASLTNAAGNPTDFDLDVVDNIGNNFGADGPGVVRFPSTLDNSDSGLTSGGVKIWYIIDATGTFLQAKTGVDAATAEASGTTIFTITIDQANDRYTVDMNGTVDAFTRVILDPTDASFVGGNDPWAGFNLPGIEDILLTPTGSLGQTLNTSNILLGVGGGQDVDFTEGVRIDFVNNLGGDPSASDPGGYADPDNRDHTFTGHRTTNGASVRISQENGDVAVATNVTANFAAFDDGPGDVNNIVGDGTPDPINGITITYLGVTYTDPITTSQIIVPTTTPTDYVISGHTFTVELLGDGSVNVTGVEGDNGSSGAGTEVAVFTASGYTTLEVSNVSSGTSFKISGFGTSEPSQDPVEIHLPTEIVDGDGDVVVGGDIDITFTPPAPPVVLDLDGDGVEFLDLSAGVAYDYGNGLVATAWAGADDGILVRDANGDGTVTDASEFVFGGNGQTDMEALHAQYGEQLDASDADFTMFAVWNDANSNGVVDGNELQSLADAGITSINLVSDGQAYTAANGDVTVAGTSTYTKTDGTTGDVADAAFVTGGKSMMETERVAANSNNVVLAAAVAAAGFAVSAPAAASVETDDVGSGRITNAIVSVEAVDLSILNLSTDTAMPALMGEMRGAFGTIEMPFQSTMSMDFGSSIGELSNGHFDSMAPTALLAGSDMLAGQMAMPMLANNVAMPSAEALVAMAGLNNAQSTVTVEKIVADALQGGGGPDINALLNALPGHGIAANAGIDSLASLSNGFVPTWDTGHGAGFTFAGTNVMTSEALVLHHDAIQPVANG